MSNFIVEDWIFWFCAISGTALFALQLILSHVGSDPHHEFDDGSSGAHDAGFKWLSKQAMTGFLMMFGWVGLTCSRQFGLGAIGTLLISLLGGFFSLFITGSIFRGARRLRSPGNVFCMDEAIGKQATVYQQIPVNGIGKISIILQDLTYEIDAISPHTQILPSFTEVQVIKKMDEKTAVVVPTNR